MTRIKSNTKITVLEQIEVAKPKTCDGKIISDQQVIFGDGNHGTERFRLVTALTKGQKLLRIVTKRFDISPNEVADICQHAAISSFFHKHEVIA